MKNQQLLRRMMRYLKFLSHPETARDFLDSYLPAPLRELCDLNTLKLEPGVLLRKTCVPVIPMFCGR